MFFFIVFINSSADKFAVNLSISEKTTSPPQKIEEFAVGNLTYQNPWYISAKNAILFLGLSIFGLGLFSVFINEGFVVNDYEGPKVLLLLPLLLASVMLYAAVFFGKKIFGNSVKNVDKLSKKMVFWTLLISVFLSLLIGFSGMGSGMGG